MITHLFFLVSYLSWLYQRIKRWTKPDTLVFMTGIGSDRIRSRSDLIIENVLLRQQWVIHNRQVKRSLLTSGDRIRMTMLARCLHNVQPDTVLRWHWELFRFYWRWKSKGKTKKPKIPVETINLIRKVAKENHLWGGDRIRGELLKLGSKVSKRIIQKYMTKTRKSSSPSQTWAIFLKNQAKDIWACDFTVVYDWLFRPWLIFVMIELKTRLIVHTGITRCPTDEWTAKQLREATP